MKQTIRFADLASQYDGFILDLWGVIHDGIAPFPAALHCLQQLAGKPILLLSNAPRRASAVAGTLRALGIADSLYSHILTSGEATWQALHDRTDPWFASLGQRVYHLGPVRDRNVIAGLGLQIATAPSHADFVVNTGPDDERDAAGLEAFTDELAACLHAALPMICANPDLEIVRGDQRILCAGALAQWYEGQGGQVRWIGKPDPAIYTRALGTMGLEKNRVLAVGDSLRTDIAGAANAGIDSAWVLGGIHASEVNGDHARAVDMAAAAGLVPKMILDGFAW